LQKRPEYRKRDIDRSRELRKDASPAERILWKQLSGGKIGNHRFTRQFQIGPYFCDITCRSAKLIVEVDGYSHDTRLAHDRTRDTFLQKEGYRVLRFTNEDVMQNLEGVVVAIAQALGPSPSPSRKREGRSS
jgi:very-short-patch-repair endonuclease